MSKTAKTTGTKTNTANTETRSVGRPAYVPVWPTTKEWTFRDLEIANGVDPDTGKGAQCSALTLRKYLKKDMKNKAGAARPNSMVILVKGKLEKPASDNGLGRKQLVYALRNPIKVAAPAAEPVAVNVGTDSAPATDPAPGTDITPAADSAPVTEPVADTAPAPVADTVADAAPVTS